jgi:hypothetical protein
MSLKKATAKSEKKCFVNNKCNALINLFFENKKKQNKRKKKL